MHAPGHERPVRADRALGVLTCSLLPYYGYEARSYAIYFMLSALSLWVWTCTRRDSKPAAVVFGGVLFVGVTMHYYAFLCLAPYAVWEISRWRPGQRPSPKLVTGAIGVVSPMALLLPMISGFRPLFSSSFWAGPTLPSGSARASSPNSFPMACFCSPSLWFGACWR